MSANPCPSCGNPDPGGLTCDVCGIDLIEMPPENWEPDHETTLTSQAASALALAESGVPVFPCKADKSPLTMNGFKDASTDPAQVAAWWNQYPFALIAFPTGKASGLDVLDIDNKDGKNGFESLRLLGVDVPVTRTHRTRTGGVHHLFKSAGMGSSAGKIASGVDVRGDGGYAIWWPASGLPVEHDEVIADVPEWLIELARKPSNGAQSAPGAAEDRTDDAELMRQILTGDGYHDALLKLAARYAQHGNMDRGEAAGLLQGAMLANPDRSQRWQDRYNDIPRTVASAWEKFRKPQASSDAPTGFRFVPVRDLLSQPAPIEYLIQDTIEAGSLCQLFGASTAGKSFVALDWCACIACGVDWHDKPTRQGTVFYIAGEGHAGLGRRMRAWEIQNEIALTDAPLFFSTAPAALMDAGNAANVAEAVKALAAEHGAPALIVVDTLARNLGNGEESSNSDIGTFINNIDVMLRRAFDCSVLIVHHSGWQESHRSRGASALRAAMDHEFRLDMFDNGSRELHVTKSKEGEIPPPMPFELKQVALTDWCTPDGEIMTSAVMVHTDRVEGKRKETRLKGARKIAFDSLNITLTRDGEPASEDIKKEFGLLTPARVVHEDVWREHTYNAGISDGETDAKKKAFQRARKDLIDQGFVVTWNGYYWPFGSPLGLTGQNGTLPGHVPPVPHERRDKTGHTSIEVSRCPGADTEMSDSSEEVQ